jgi:hypothetical protein
MSIIPPRYAPKTLKKQDRRKQLTNIRKSRKLYRMGKYISRPHLSSFHSHPSPHIQHAKTLYGVNSIVPSPSLARKTRCSLASLRKIVKKGRGAYYSSGSRPNQTANSWAYARLASAITGGPASQIDHSILEEGCHSTSPALLLSA